MGKFKAFLKRKNIEISAKRYGIDALGAMAQGLFCSLLIGTIIKTLGQQLGLSLLVDVGSYAMAVSGPAMAVAIGYALKADAMVLFSLAAVGWAANVEGGAGGPLAVLIIAIVACECGKAVSKETKIDILVTPAVTILIGVALAKWIAPPIGVAAGAFGTLIQNAMALQPFWMGIAVSVLVGIALTLPISSAAICQVLHLTGLAGGAAVIADRLYYKARDGVCVYDGSLPYLISDAFGPELYRSAAAGGVRGKYYISMQDGADAWHLFVYDTSRGFWLREDSLHATRFAALDDELYMLRADGRLLSAYGSGGTPEVAFSWSATTGIMTCGLVGKKYVTRLNLRMQLPRGSKCDFWIEYDSSGQWEHAGHMDGWGARTFLLPVKPRRCDHLRFRISGTGAFKLFSIGRVLEAGSDV